MSENFKLGIIEAIFMQILVSNVIFSFLDEPVVLVETKFLFVDLVMIR